MAEADALRARERLEDMDDRVQSEGARGDVKYSGKVPPPAPYSEDLVGYKKHREALRLAAYPEYADAASKDAMEKARQKQMADDFFGDFGDAGVVINEN